MLTSSFISPLTELRPDYPLLAALTPEQLAELWDEGQRVLLRLPVPISRKHGDWATERGRWEWLLSEVKHHLWHHGEELYSLLRKEFFPAPDGTSPTCVPLLRFLQDVGADLELGVIARMALRNKDCPDAGVVQQYLDGLENAPPGWEQWLAEFARHPSFESWDEQLAFCSMEAQYHRTKNAMSKLLRYGIDPNILFVLGSKDGLLPEAMALVEDGLVEPETVLDNLYRYVSEPMRATMYRLAAHAYLHRGDAYKAVRCLQTAIELDDLGGVGLGSFAKYENQTFEQLLADLGYDV